MSWYIYLSSLPPHWVSDAAKDISFFVLLACSPQNQSMLPNWKKAIRQRVTNVYSKQPSECRNETRGKMVVFWQCWLCALLFLLVERVCVIRSVCTLVFLFFTDFHIFVAFGLVIKLDPTPTPNIGNPLKNKHLFVFSRCVWAYLFLN